MTEGAHRKALTDLIQKTIGPPARGFEIGVHRGKTSWHLLRTYPGLALGLVDSWGRDIDEAFKAEAMGRLEPFSDRIAVFVDKSTSDDVLNMVPDGALDFVFIDADHSQAGCHADVEAWWPKVRDGGLFCGHDYGKEDHPGVTVAVDDWMKAKHFPHCNCTDEGHIWWMIKPTP